MFRIRIRENGKWTTVFTTADKWEALDKYNDSPVPKMLVAKEGIVHKQYSENGFIYVGRTS